MRGLFACGKLFDNGKMLHSSMLHTFDMKYKYMKSTQVLIPLLSGFVVTLQSFQLHLSRNVRFETYLATF